MHPDHSFPSLYSSQLPPASPLLQIQYPSFYLQKEAGLQERTNHNKQDAKR